MTSVRGEGSFCAATFGAFLHTHRDPSAAVEALETCFRPVMRDGSGGNVHCVNIEVNRSRGVQKRQAV